MHGRGSRYLSEPSSIDTSAIFNSPPSPKGFPDNLWNLRHGIYDFCIYLNKDQLNIFEQVLTTIEASKSVNAVNHFILLSFVDMVGRCFRGKTFAVTVKQTKTTTHSALKTQRFIPDRNGTHRRYSYTRKRRRQRRATKQRAT